MYFQQCLQISCDVIKTYVLETILEKTNIKSIPG